MPGGLHQRVLDALGARIVSGVLAAGDVVHAESFEKEFDVSRSVVREAVRVLQSLGLVESVRRVGMRVLPAARWNVYDPLVIRWRLASPSGGVQLRSLTELRNAVEPAAAELAAIHASDDEGAELVGLAARMRSLGRAGDLDGFLALDIEFHSRVMRASGNDMFASLDRVIAEVLTGRTDQGLMPSHPHEEALAWHAEVADAVHGRRPDDAHRAMDRIMRRAFAEMAEIWADEPRPRL